MFLPPPQVNSWASQTKEDALTNPKTAGDFVSMLMNNLINLEITE